MNFSQIGHYCILQVQVTVDQLWSDDIEVTSIGPGENVKVKLKGIEEEDVSPGFVLCDTAEPITTGRVRNHSRVVIAFTSSILIFIECMRLYVWRSG